MTATAFAPASDLATRLGRTFDQQETLQVEALLLDASDHLRALIGQEITAGTATFTTSVPIDECWLELPQLPARGVTSVTIGGQASTSWQLVDQALLLTPGTRDAGFGWWSTTRGLVTVTVTYDYGMTEVPGELRSWSIVLASQALAQVEALGSIGSAGMQSSRVDDYAENFATTGSGAQAYSIPDRVVEDLRARYGRGAYVTGGRW